MLQSAQLARYDGDATAAFHQHTDNIGAVDDKRVVHTAYSNHVYPERIVSTGDLDFIFKPELG